MENNLDKLFKSKLEGLEPEFHPSAWERMEGLLDKEGMIPDGEKPKRSRNFFLFFLLFFSLLITAVGYYSIYLNEVRDEGSTHDITTVPMAETSQTAQASKDSKTTISSKNVSQNNAKRNEGSNEAANLASAMDALQINEKENYPKIKLDENISNLQNRNTSTLKETSAEDGDTESQFSGSTGDIDKSSGIDGANDFPSEMISAKLLSGSSKSEFSGRNISLHEEDELEEKHDEEISQSGTEVSKLEIDFLPIMELLPLLNKVNPGPTDLSNSSRLVRPMIQNMGWSAFESGIQTSIRFNGGLGYSVGPYLGYEIGKGYDIRLGVQFDVQNYTSGPELSVYDKVYSFGSELKERKFSLASQKSMRIPLSISKAVGGLKITSGVIFNKVFISEGDLTNFGEPDIQEGIGINNEMISPLSISFQLGAAIRLNRYFDFGFGMEYRPQAFASDSSISNDRSKVYPTLGLRYKLLKF